MESTNQETYTNGVNRYISKLTNLLFGDIDQLKLSNKIYILASLVATLACSFGYIWNYYIELTFAINIIVGIIMLTYASLYYLARFKNKYYPIALFLISQLGLAFTWLTSAGLMGSVLPFYLVSIAPLLSISKPRYHFMYLVINLTIISILLFIEESDYNYLIIQYPDEITGKYDIIFSFIFSLILTYAYTHLLILGYVKENQLVVKQKKELEELNASKDKFFSIIAHDLRGPFSGITELTRFMADESHNLSKEELITLSRKISRSASSTYGLLDNLLNYSKVNQGLIEYRPERITLKTFNYKYLEAINDMAKNKNISITNSIANDIIVTADTFMLQTILCNLIINSIKFTPTGGHIIIDAQQIDTNTIEISVTDDGVGMNKTMIENIFTMSKQVRRNGTNNEPSSGLGLLLVKEYVYKQNGRIIVDSLEEKGSTFRFTVPAG